MVLHLQDFILIGKLGEIAIGSTKTDVLKSFGSPGKTENHENGLGAIIYNGFCFFYLISTEKIYAILCQEFEDAFKVKPVSTVFKISNAISFDTQFFTIAKNTNYRQVLDYLRQEKINFHEESHKFRDKIICESGVEFLFNNWLEYPEDEDYDREELILCGFRNFPVKSV